MPDVKVKRIYDPVAPADGRRVLVDRLWPRGLAKERAPFDAWMRDVAPSTALRTWYGHQPERFPEFARRYRSELAACEALLADLRATRGTLTLLTASRAVDHSGAAVLASVLRES